MNLLAFLIPAAHAQAAGGQPQGMGLSTLLFPVILIAIMYFLMIRPQMKRQKEHKALIEKIKRGDEVLTNGGLVGKVTDVGDNFVTIEVADNVRIRVQKGAIGSVLLPGTLDSAK
ncbi:preprotein translocase subunit YajC [Stenotrophomonas sp. C3(2023)]|uniref:preprotein translocase subunit YajC n=1 Tax=Stenotrophomonas sp. C3(2023) TaxID=3080277 RepID=UPI00293C5D31|nr:preprotein translocase subunit YajC [Stenotrophomonas sp. C3(2023)]MDV3468968.1 preprotein translocase subunit YajC [Stenotrophomonas sp. C3(2023)]